MKESSPSFPPQSEHGDQSALSPVLEPPSSHEDSLVTSFPNRNAPIGCNNPIISEVHQGYHFYYRPGNTTLSDQHNFKLNQVSHSHSGWQSEDAIDEHCKRQNYEQIHQGYCRNQGQADLSSSLKEKTRPNMIISLAQRLLPAVVQRLCHQDDRRRKLQWAVHNDDFEGHCSPLGNSSTEDVLLPNKNINLKTTGLEDDELHTSIQAKEGCPYQNQTKESDLEMGDPSDYLPHSAALLITVLQNSAKNDQKKIDRKLSGEDLSFSMEETVKETDAYPRERFTATSNMENFEREAEALLESIRGDHSKRGDSNMNASNYIDNHHAIPSFDDDDSIGGEMVRLSRSVAFLQRDLEDADLSHFDNYEDGCGEICDFNNFEGEGTAWSRMKLWFSRAMIMEQKLLNSYTRMGVDSHGSNLGPTTSTSYADNPVLIWSLAIMWAFALLVMSHSQISEWAEGEDPGILADVIEWLFS